MVDDAGDADGGDGAGREDRPLASATEIADRLGGEQHRGVVGERASQHDVERRERLAIGNREGFREVAFFLLEREMLESVGGLF